MAETLGDCFEKAAELLRQFDDTGEAGATLVHGAITGQGPIEGVVHAHAWVEFSGLAFDVSNGREIVMPAEEYREIARLRFAREYTTEEGLTKMLLTGHYGPWDPEFDGVA